jgi:type I restriction enzyme S subunit
MSERKQREGMPQVELGRLNSGATKLKKFGHTSEWRPSTWGAEISLEYGKALRGYSKEVGPYRVFGSNGPIGWTSEPLAPGPGVILGRKGAYRGIQYSADPFFVIDTAYYVVPKNESDMRWLYYAMKHYKLGEINDGSPIPSTTRSAVYISELNVPEPHEQCAIAKVLGTLDDKIELNRKMNETLEAMARALFKSWFVDFDPVRAKTEDRPTGLPAHIDALFPDSLEDSELGEIPKGWGISTIRDLASKIQYGLTTSAQADSAGPRFLRITDIQGGSVDWSKVPYCNASEKERDDYRIKSHDIFVARTGASTGENVYVLDPPVAVFASYLVRFQFRDAAYARFVGAFMRTAAYKDYVASSVGGSAQPNASAQVLAGASIVCPPPIVCRKFADLLAPLDREACHNDSESQLLAGIRDALLPALVSGEIRLGTR